jgi:hypothetical protein
VLPEASWQEHGFDEQVGEKGIVGSLVLGGYDRSRAGAGVSISMPGTANSTLVVGVQSMTITSSPSAGGNVYSTTSSSLGFFAVVDSASPYLWMPRVVCDAFEALFMLTYDSASGHYLVNSTAREHNRKQNAVVSIQIGDDVRTGTDSVSIELPYDAFDLEGTYPMFQNTTRYFPIRRATDGVNVIGRVFMQEAMLVVDYERGNFTVAPARFSSPLLPADIVPIAGILSLVPNTSKANPLAIALPIVLVALVAALAAALWFFRCRSLRQHGESGRASTGPGRIQEADSDSVHEIYSPTSPPAYEAEKSFAKNEAATIALVELPGSSDADTKDHKGIAKELE